MPVRMSQPNFDEQLSRGWFSVVCGSFDVVPLGFPFTGNLRQNFQKNSYNSIYVRSNHRFACGVSLNFRAYISNWNGNFANENVKVFRFWRAGLLLAFLVTVLVNFIGY